MRITRAGFSPGPLHPLVPGGRARHEPEFCLSYAQYRDERTRRAYAGEFARARELGMITEHAELPVIAGREAEFEEAFATAKSLIAASPGFGGLTLSRCIERPNVYLLLVQWESVEAHNVGFRGSPAYQEWRALLHHFYDPFPFVEHYEWVTSA
jgi:heme-degrading monooxygenase HmoA